MFRALAIACAAALLAVACRSEPAPGPADEFRLGVAPIRTLDPLAVAAGVGNGDEELVVRQIYEGLVSYDRSTLEPQPALAASWSVSPDARRFTFHLRSGVRFHDGTPLRAADVAYSLNRLASSVCEPEVSPLSTAPAQLLSSVTGFEEVAEACDASELEGVVVHGEDVVEIVLDEPWADLPAALGHTAVLVVPEGSSSEGLDEEPVGTGPFRVVAPWRSGAVQLERFSEWRGVEPAFTEVLVTGYENQAAAYTDLLQGELHQAPVPIGRARHAQRVFGEDGFVHGTGVTLFGVDLSEERMTRQGFRSGLSMAVDRDSLATAIFDGTRVAAHGLTSPAVPGAERDACGALCAFDLEAASDRVAAAYPGGSPEIRLGYSSEGSNPAVGEGLATMLEEAGVPVRSVEQRLSEHVRSMQDGELDLFQLAWEPPYPALDGVLWPMFRSGSPDNHTRYRNPEVDALLERARRTTDDEERAEIFREAERRILADLPVIPLLWSRTSVAVDPRIGSTDGVLVDGLGFVNFARLASGGDRRPAE